MLLIKKTWWICTLLVLALSGSNFGFLNEEPFERISTYSDLSERMIKTNKVISLFLHKGDCGNSESSVDRSCREEETIYQNFGTEVKDKGELFVLDCEDAAKVKEGDPEIKLEDTFLQICLKENQDNLPGMMFLQPPVVNYDSKSGQFYGHTKMDFKEKISVENLKTRFDELQPAFRAILDSDESFEEVKKLSDKMPAIIYFNNVEETPEHFKLITQEYKGKLFFGEIQANTTLPNSYEESEDQPRPFVLVLDKDKMPLVVPDIQNYQLFKNLAEKYSDDQET